MKFRCSYKKNACNRQPLFFCYHNLKGHTFDCHMSAPRNLESHRKEHELRGELRGQSHLHFPLIILEKRSLICYSTICEKTSEMEESSKSMY